MINIFFNNATEFLNYHLDIRKVVLNFSQAGNLIEEKAKLKKEGGINHEPCKMESNEGNGDTA